VMGFKAKSPLQVNRLRNLLVPVSSASSGGQQMIRLSLSACLVSLVVWAAAAQQLVPKPGFTEKRERGSVRPHGLCGQNFL
jgi:hypothetical protein